MPFFIPNKGLFWLRNNFCPVKVPPKERPYGCQFPLIHPDSLVCDFCPKFLEAKGLELKKNQFRYNMKKYNENKKNMKGKTC